MLIRESRDQHSFDNSPGLIAVFHALHRLLAPRHPPHALSSLTALILPSNDLQAHGWLSVGFRRSKRKPLLLLTHGSCQPLLALRAGDPNHGLSNVRSSSLMGSCRDPRQFCEALSPPGIASLILGLGRPSFL